MTDDLTFLPIGTLSDLLDTRRIGAEPLTRQCLARSESLGRSLNCFITLCPDTALAEARAADARAAAGRRLGKLDGIPVALKDNIDVAGVSTTNGFGGKPRIPSEDAAVTSCLRDAGAVILGKLAMHEGALGATTDNPHHGRTHNPFRHGYSPGGSSGGSGAAVAAGLCYAALGTDTGGSVRIPASWCGVVGLKPSYGLISTRGVVPLSYRLDHIGPLTRTVADAALLLDTLAGYDPRSAESRRAPPPDDVTTPSLSGLRIAVLANFFAENVDQQITDIFARSIAQLSNAGASIETITLPAFDPIKVRRACFVRVEAEAAHIHGPLYRQEPERFSPAMRGYLDYGLRLPATRLLQADRVMEEAAGALNACWDGFDMILSPTTPQAAPSFDTIPPDSTGTFCVLANIGGYPAISLPMGVTTGGLPVGMQIVAPLHEDRRLLAIAAAVENLIGSFPRPQIATN